MKPPPVRKSHGQANAEPLASSSASAASLVAIRVHTLGIVIPPYTPGAFDASLALKDVLSKKSLMALPARATEFPQPPTRRPHPQRRPRRYGGHSRRCRSVKSAAR